MTHRHAQRRGVVPRPSDADIRLWRRLIKRAEVIAADSAKPGEPMVIAAEKAAKAIAPVGHQQDRNSPFIRLVRTGQGWLRLGADERAARAGDLRAMARDCAEVLDQAGGESARTRKDIDE
jgi:hypothetical protein